MTWERFQLTSCRGESTACLPDFQQNGLCEAVICLCAVTSYITTCHGLGNKALPSDEWAVFRIAGVLHPCKLMSLSSHCKNSGLSLDTLLGCSFRSPGKPVYNAEFLLVSAKTCILLFFLLR